LKAPGSVLLKLIHDEPPSKFAFKFHLRRYMKAVMLAQQEAKALERRAVGVEHIMLGLIAEEAKKGGYLGRGLHSSTSQLNLSRV